MSRFSATPLNYKTTDGLSIGNSQLFSPGGAAGFTIDPSGTLTDDATDTFGGNATSLLQIGDGLDTHQVNDALTVPVDTTGKDIISVAIKLESQDFFNDVKNGTNRQVTLYLGSGGSGANSSFYKFTAELGEGWNLASINKSEFSVAGGTLDWSAINWVQLRMVNTIAGSHTVRWGGIWAEQRQRTKLAISFDDGRVSVINDAFPYMQARGIVGNLFINSANIGLDSSFMTWDDVRTFRDAGWGVYNHSAVHDTMILDQVNWQANLLAGKNALLAEGISDGHNIMAPPGGTYDDAGTQIAKDMGYEWMRGVDDTYVNFSLGKSKQFNLPSKVLQGAGVSLTDATDYVKELRRKGVTGFVYLHIVENPETAAGWDNTAKFQPFIDFVELFIEQGQIDVKTFTELVKLKDERNAA